MGELIKYLIERLKSRPASAEALLIAAIIAVVFLGAQQLATKPDNFATIQNCYFQASVIIILSTWVASICWRFAKIRTLRIIATLTFVATGIAGATTVIRISHIKPLKIRIIFDESVDMPPATMTKLVSLLRSKLFNIEISDKAITVNTYTNGTVTDDEVRSVLNAQNLLSPGNDPNKPLPILITSKVLENSEWSNLLMISWDDAAVISIWDIGSTASISDTTVRRYVATSVALESLVSYSLQQKKEILEDRTPDLYKGCLHDFHRTRETYEVQSQNPALCDAEAIALEKIFGEASVKALKTVFDNISKDN